MQHENIRQGDNSQLAQENGSASKSKFVVKEVISYILVLITTVVILSFVFTLNRIPSGSMEPTIATNSIAVSWRLPYLFKNPIPNRGDIVTFREVGEVGRILIKRVIGLPGDTIHFEDGKVFVNGEELIEPYLLKQDSTKAITTDYTVPEGCIFVLGDNREHSSDSRFSDTPFIPAERIIARYLFSYKSLIS